MAYVTAQPNINPYGYQAGYYPNQPYPNQSYPYGNPPYDPTNTQQQYQYPPPGGDYYNQNAYQGGYAPVCFITHPFSLKGIVQVNKSPH